MKAPPPSQPITWTELSTGDILLLDNGHTVLVERAGYYSEAEQWADARWLTGRLRGTALWLSSDDRPILHRVIT